MDEPWQIYYEELTRRFGQTVKAWIEEGEFSWDDLQQGLEATQLERDQGRQRSTP